VRRHVTQQQVTAAGYPHRPFRPSEAIGEHANRRTFRHETLKCRRLRSYVSVGRGGGCGESEREKFAEHHTARTSSFCGAKPRRNASCVGIAATARAILLFN